MTMIANNERVSFETVERLVQLLADGHYHSGQDIGRFLGVSRTAVWKRLQQLSPLGVNVVAVKGKGYCLSQKIELLNRDIIWESLSESIRNAICELDLLFSVGSTNNQALSYKGEFNGDTAYICLAEHQQLGRGRRGRKWVSPFGCGVYASFLYQFEQGAASLEGLSLAVAVVILRALRKLGVHDLSLKWPNDLLLNKKKVGGILLEMRGDPSGRCQVVVGIGLNLAWSGMENSIDQPWTTLQEELPLSRNRVVIALISEMLPLLQTYQNRGFPEYRAEWESADAFLDQMVCVISGNNITKGVASGVSENGALLLNIDGDMRSFHGGELSLRPVAEVGHDTGS